MDFHAAIVQIAGVARQLQLSRYALNEIAETHALNSPANEVASGGWYHEFIMNGTGRCRGAV